MFNLGFGGFQGWRGAVPQAYQPQMMQRQMGSMLGGYQPQSIFSNRMAQTVSPMSMTPPQNGNTPYQFGYGMPPLYPGYTLPQMGNQPNPFRAGNQPINPVGDVLNPQQPVPNPAQPQNPAQDQIDQMWAMYNAQQGGLGIDEQAGPAGFGAFYKNTTGQKLPSGALQDVMSNNLYPLGPGSIGGPGGALNPYIFGG